VPPSSEDTSQQLSALVTNIQGYSVHDGPGIRTTVFLKGCVLACRWCANPECISAKPEIGYIRSLCNRCGACLSVCTMGAISPAAAGYPLVDRKLCTACGECVSACCYKARVLHGKSMTVAQVFDAVVADKLFYDASGGGVTVSGGEPLMCPGFVRALFEALHRAGVHTCIETSGCVETETLLEVLSITDYVLFDLKLMGSATHRAFTGKPNELVLANAQIVARSSVDFLFRMPLIPGVNDGHENIQETARFLHGLGERAERIELMPYHRLGESKYTSLGRRYRLHGVPAAGTIQIEAARLDFERNGIGCSVST
jgi:pyruvate formate lyase activating enzyme